MRQLFVIMAVVSPAAVSFGNAYGPATDSQPVGAAIERVATRLAGRIGFAAQEIRGDEVVSFNADQAFVMASTYKVAIATASVNRLDKNDLSLDQLVDIPPKLMVVSERVLAETFVHPGLQISVRNLIEVMITESSITATDTSIGLAGRAAAVTGRLPRSLARCSTTSTLGRMKLQTSNPLGGASPACPPPPLQAHEHEA